MISYKKLFAFEVFFQLIEKAARILIGFVVIKKLSNYFGPADFGNINYIESFLTLLLGVSFFGMDTILVKKFLKKGTISKEKIFINGFILMLLISLLIIFITLIFFNYFISFKYYSLLVLTVFTIVLNPFSISEFQLISANKIRFVSILKTIVFILISLLKILAINLKLSIDYFVYLIIFEFILGLFIVNVYNFIKFNLKLIDVALLKELIKDGLSMFLYSMGALLYMRIDIIMIQKFLPESELGFYTAAFKLYSFILFIPGIISITIFPRIISENKVMSPFISKAYKLTFILGIMAYVLFYLSGDKIIEIIFGSEFEFSKGLFKILILGYLITSLSTIHLKIIYNNNLQNRLVFKVIFAIFLTVILNFILIEKYGVYGAAYSTLLTLFFLEFIYDFFDPKLRRLQILKLKSFLNFKNNINIY
jgi:O-antigen/teichoic acid export membrane protein